MADVTLKGLLAAGVHFGHQVSRWDPRMRPYIFSARNGIHIINLEQTVPLLFKAHNFLLDQVARGGKVLFVGTKPQARDVIEEEAKRAGMPYVAHRWLGGMLTNFRTIKQSIDRLRSYYERDAKGELAKLTKREQLRLRREAEKMEQSLGGIKDLDHVPTVVVIVDPKKEHIAQAEANRLHLPVIALTDTNCDPSGIDFVIPGNDDAMRAVQLVIANLADACVAGMEKRQQVIRQEVAAKSEGGVAKVGNPRAVEHKVGAKGRSFTSKPDAAEKAVVNKGSV